MVCIFASRVLDTFCPFGYKLITIQIHAASVQLLDEGQYESAVFELLSTEHNGAGFLVDYIRGLALVFF